MRLIYADKLIGKLLINSNGQVIPEVDCDNFPIELTIKEVKDLIKKQPTVDAVEVVRCKNCVHNKQIECPLSYTSAISDYGTVTVYYKNKDDGYCSYGEREDGAE